MLNHHELMKKNRHICMNGFFVVLVSMLLLSSTVYAEPKVIETDPNTGKPLHNQIHNQTAQNTQNTQTQDTQPVNTLASLQQPSATQLSQANQELLTHNAQLQREINDLQTQVNVLVNERSGQLFLYGAITAILAFLAGIFITVIIFGRKGRW